MLDSQAGTGAQPFIGSGEVAPRQKAGRSEPGGGEKSSLGEFVRHELRQAIKQGRYGPGDRVRESEVLSWLDVSRTPVREAMHRLKADGLLAADPAGGYRVAGLDSRQVQEFYEVRATLEAQAARSAAQHISSFEIEFLEDLLQQSYANIGSVKKLRQCDDAFHAAIYDAAHNRYLRQTLTNLRSVLGLLRGSVYDSEDRRRASLDEHKAIFEAVRNRDGDAAFEAATRHMSEVSSARLKMMQEERR